MRQYEHAGQTKKCSLSSSFRHERRRLLWHRRASGRAAIWAASNEVDDVKDWDDDADLGRVSTVTRYDAATGSNIVNQVASAYDGWCSGSPMTSTTAGAAASPRSSAGWTARTSRTSAR